MSVTLIDLVWKRVERSRQDSAIAVFHNLLIVGEALLKTITTAFVASVGDDKDRHRYGLCHKLIRADGLGEWADVLADISSGPALQHLSAGALDALQELTTRHKKDSWVYEATLSLQHCLEAVLPNTEKLPSGFDGRLWYTKFIYLRNKTRGHGAVTDDVIRRIVNPLERSIHLLIDNGAVLKKEWVYLKRNLSGKYNVINLGNGTTQFDYLKSDRNATLPDGVYIHVGQPSRIELMDSSADIVDFYYPNGRFRRIRSEWISYISGTRKDVDATDYLIPVSALPPSETEGHRDLRVVGRCLANLPPSAHDYVDREELQAELISVLVNDRHPIITLVGRGGTGKTSLALNVLHRIAKSTDERFLIIVWLSARDIDLLPQGAKVVTPRVISLDDITKEIVNLLQPFGIVHGKGSKQQTVERLLRENTEGAILFVFDNFETIQQPVDIYNWLDANIRPPNKILITTRHSDFRGDYEVEVGGMTESQCNALVERTAGALGMLHSVTPSFQREIFRESEGHPYVVKMLIGECARIGKFGKVERIIASRDDILNALFERTYARLSPGARRVFLTLCTWRSLVPLIGIKASLLRPADEDRIDISAAVDELKRLSFVDEERSEQDGAVFLSVPVAAALFGRRKLATAPDVREIENGTRFLQRFGPMQPSDVKHGLAPRIQRFFSNLSEALQGKKLRLPDEMPSLEMIGRNYAPAWLLLADLIEESGTDTSGELLASVLNRYLETGPPTKQQKLAWDRVAQISRRRGDWLGFLNAVVHVAELPDADISTISSAANTFNSVFKNIEVQLDPQDKRSFARRLIAVMKEGIAAGDSTDCSRLAWLLLQVGEENAALQVVNRGLRLDPANEYCLRLRQKLGGDVSAEAIAGL